MSVDIKRILEALIFVSEGPLSLAQMSHVLETEDKDAVQAALLELVAEYQELGRAFSLVEVAGGYVFRTRSELAFWLRRLRREQVTRLSRAALETLAIIAYKQPVLKADIERLRGVEVGGVLRMLMEKDLVRVVGRKDLPGRPLVYGTTKRFLEVFDLKDLSDLPTLEEMEALAGEPEIALEADPQEDLFSRAAGRQDLEDEEQGPSEHGNGDQPAEAAGQPVEPGPGAGPSASLARQPSPAEADPLGWAGPEPAAPRLRAVDNDSDPQGGDEPPRAA